MEEKRESAPAPTANSVITGATTLVVGPSDGAGGVSVPSVDTPWGPMGALGDRLYAPELLRKVLSAAVDVWRTMGCGHSASLEPLLDSVGALVRLGLLPGRAESEPQDLVVISKVELDALRSQAAGSERNLMKEDLARAMEERESFRQQAERLAAELAGLLPEPTPPSRRTIGFRELAEQRMERIMALHEALAKVYAAARPDLDDDSTDALDAVRHLKNAELGGFADELCEWLRDVAGATPPSAEEVCADPRGPAPERLAVQADRAQAYEVLCTRLGFTESTTELWPVDRVTVLAEVSFGPFPPMSRVVLDDLVSFVERALQVARREPDLMTEACEKLWRATAGRVTPRLVVDTADVDVDGATRA